MKLLPVLLLAMLVPARAEAAERVVVLELDDTIQPASLRYLERGLTEAAEAEAELVVIELDTPGGLLVSLRAMLAEILASPVPVAVYVTPAGAHAASAGFFLLLAADVAAMAPGTNTGAAHPVMVGGTNEDDGDASAAKATEDVAALARSLAAQRGRSAEWAEKAVRESLSYTADEALEYGLIDYVAPSRAALLERLEGARITRPDGSQQTLAVDRAQVVTIDRTLGERFLSVIADPQIAYLLLTIGAMCLLLELLSPGLIVPGVLGGLSILVATYGLSLLPVSWVGVLLIAAGLGLLVAEIFVTSYGLLAIGGTTSFVIGSLMLVEAPIPDLRIGLEVVLPVTAVLVGLVALLVGRALRTRRQRPRSGLEAMIGEHGAVIAGIDPAHDGTVFVHGEYWTATAARTLPAGVRVRVERIDGNRLHVEPVELPAKQGERA